MRKAMGMRFGLLGKRTVHLCVDMQRLFADDTPWKTPWMDRVAPCICELTARRPEATIFTRFIPAERAGQGRGVWKRYWRHWSCMTLENLGKEMVDLIPSLAIYAPPARIIDKSVNSPWLDGALEVELQQRGADSLIITGGETDVCVLATVLRAIDRGYRIVIATDALCSSSDETHEALLKVYAQRYGQQIETATSAQILHNWRL